jgi:hypothetical protein
MKETRESQIRFDLLEGNRSGKKHDETIEIYVPAGTLTPYLKACQSHHELSLSRFARDVWVGQRETYQ